VLGLFYFQGENKMNVFSKFTKLREVKTVTIDGEQFTVEFRALSVGLYRQMLEMGPLADYYAVLHGVYDAVTGVQMFSTLEEVQEISGSVVMQLAGEVATISTKDLLQKKTTINPLESKS
jgi:hypothetical protein